MGQLILSCAAPIAFERVLQAARTTATPQHELELQTFGVSHAEIGGHLLGLWGQPLPIVEAVAFHHRPSADSALDRKAPVLDLAYLAAGGWDASLPA